MEVYNHPYIISSKKPIYSNPLEDIGFFLISPYEKVKYEYQHNDLQLLKKIALVVIGIATVSLLILGKIFLLIGAQFKKLSCHVSASSTYQRTNNSIPSKPPTKIQTNPIAEEDHRSNYSNTNHTTPKAFTHSINTVPSFPAPSIDHHVKPQPSPIHHNPPVSFSFVQDNARVQPKPINPNPPIQSNLVNSIQFISENEKKQILIEKILDKNLSIADLDEIIPK